MSLSKENHIYATWLQAHAIIANLLNAVEGTLFENREGDIEDILTSVTWVSIKMKGTLKDHHESD